jgi:hypothetical protein
MQVPSWQCKRSSYAQTVLLCPPVVCDSPFLYQRPGSSLRPGAYVPNGGFADALQIVCKCFLDDL